MAGERGVELPGARVPFAWRAFADKLRGRAALGDEPASIAKEATWRLALLGANQLGWALDDLLVPDWRDVRVRGPVFILGHQRSGTTFLHRMLVEDALEGAFGMPLAAMLVPSVVAHRAAAWAHSRRPGAWLRARVAQREEALFGPLDPIHHIRFGAVEEDEFALWSIFASGMCANDSPTTAAAEALAALRAPERWPAAAQRAALGWYRACLQKNIAAHGAREGLAVAKNPAFGKRVPALLEAFPDARFVHLVRNPLEAIPSRLSLVQAIWRLRVPGFRELELKHVEAFVADSVRTYLETDTGLAQVAPERVIEVPFEELTRAPEEVVQRIAAAFGLRVRDGLGDALQARGRRRKGLKGVRGHRYVLEDFGLDEEGIRARLPSVFARYGW